MYSYIKDNDKGGKTAKEIKKNVIREDIEHENYKNVLFNNKEFIINRKLSEATVINLEAIGAQQSVIILLQEKKIYIE